MLAYCGHRFGDASGAQQRYRTGLSHHHVAAAKLIVMRFAHNGSAAGRMARLRLRLPTGRVELHVVWPHWRGAPPMLVIGLPSSGNLEALVGEAAARVGVLAIGVRTDPAPPATDGLLRVVSWVCEHATELGADPARLAVAGINPATQAVAAAVVEAAARAGWPPITLELPARSPRPRTGTTDRNRAAQTRGPKPSSSIEVTYDERKPSCAS